MFMRILNFKVKPDNIVQLRHFYDYDVIPELQQMPGCRFAGLIQHNSVPEEFLSLSSWTSLAQAQTFEKSRIYQELIKRCQPYLTESTEWKVHLSREQDAQYAPVPDEPILKQFTTSTESGPDRELKSSDQSLHMRIVSLKIQKEKMADFKQLYINVVIPELQKIQGFRYAYMIEDLREKGEVLSITGWDKKEDAERFESSGKFLELINQVKHTFSNVYQWKVALEKDLSSVIKTSDDLKINHYNIVSGKTFE